MLSEHPRYPVEQIGGELIASMVQGVYQAKDSMLGNHSGGFTSFLLQSLASPRLPKPGLEGLAIAVVLNKSGVSRLQAFNRGAAAVKVRFLAASR